VAIYEEADVTRGVDQGKQERAKIMALSRPTISPPMIWRGLGHSSLPYPFNDPLVEYFSLGRNALYAAIQRLNLRGQEVLFPAYFEGIELDTLLQGGVQLRFYPVRNRMRVDLTDVISAMRPETRAVYLIHYQGFPSPVEELAEICKKRELLLIEDCAVALLSRIGERPLGSFGDAAIFSIRKTLPVELAGALVLRNRDRSNGAKRRAPHILTTLGSISFSVMRHFELRGKNWPRSLLHHARRAGKKTAGIVTEEREWVGGDNFVLSNADVGISKLTYLIIRGQGFPLIVERRRQNFLQLLHRLSKLVQPVHDSLPVGVCPISFAFQHDRKDDLLKKLKTRNLAADIWGAEHTALPKSEFLEAEQMRRTTLQLSCHQDLTPEAVDWLADQVCDALQELS